MTHVDLFSGIGGFALAAAANEIRTVQFVEIDERCREFLSKAWKGIPVHDDIRTFNGTTHRGAWLLTAGVPCQPSSRAGKQRGAEDHRWLWPEALRVLREVAPTWCLFENPPGIGDLEFDGILADVEAQGYEVEVISLPACAVNAPHRRERYWIVCRNVADAGRLSSGEDEPGRGQDRRAADRRAGALNMADTAKARRKADGRQNTQRFGALLSNTQGDVGHTEIGTQRAGLCNNRSREQRWHELADAGIWFRSVWLPCADNKIRRAPDDSFSLVDGLHRSVLRALGNSIVPQIAARIIAAMKEADNA